MSNDVFFSIIIPTYNRAVLIEKTLKSIVEQDYSNFEILIIDDGSTDNTYEIVKPYLSENVKFFRKDNAERGAARNFGTLIANGKYINWFDSDDLALSNHLIEANRFCTKKNDPEVFHLGYQHIDLFGKIIFTTNNLNNIINEKLFKGNVLSCNGVFVRKDIALNNLFNENRDLSASEDYELWMRLASKFPIYCSNTITSSIVNHSDRSVFTMVSKEKLIKRFTYFILITTGNPDIKIFLGTNYNYFIMKNFLLLSVDLASKGFKKESLKYLLMGCKKCNDFYKERTFYAILKQLLIK